MMNRLRLMKTHALLAAFMLPVAIMYMTTGALYTWGITGKHISDVYEIQLTHPLQPDLHELTKLAEAELPKLHLKTPTGTPKLKITSGHFVLEWTGSSKDITLEPTKDAHGAILTVKKATWYRNLVQLHKAKGGKAFKIYAVLFATALSLLLISGYIMAWQIPKLKRLTLITSLLGIGSFIFFAWLS